MNAPHTLPLTVVNEAAACPCPSHAESGAAQENHSYEQSTRCELCTLPAVTYMRIVDRGEGKRGWGRGCRCHAGAVICSEGGGGCRLFLPCKGELMKRIPEQNLVAGVFVGWVETRPGSG